MLSFLKTYLGVSGDVTTVWIQLVTPRGRKATTYPKPSPFCSSSGTGCKGETVKPPHEGRPGKGAATPVSRESHQIITDVL